MARWASFIDSKRAEGPVLLLDTGNFCRASRGKTDELDYRYFFEGMKRMGYDAVGLAGNEIRFGKKQLLEAVEEASLPVTSANIFDKRDGQMLAAPWIIKDLGGRMTITGRKGGIRAGIFSVVLPMFIYEIDPLIPKYYEIVNPRIAALDAVSHLREKGCDIIIAISHQGWMNSMEFAADIPGIDIVVNGKRSHEGTYYEYADSTIVVDTGVHRVSFTEIEVAYRNGKRFIKATDMGAAAHSSDERADLAEIEKKYQEELKKK